MTSAQSKARYARSLGTLPMFTSVPLAAVRDLERRLIFARHAPGSVVYRQGETAEGIFFVFEGRVKLSAIAIDAKTALLNIAHPGDVLGLAAVISERPHLATSQATIPSVVALLRREHLGGAMRKCPQLSEAVAQWLATECKEYVRDMLLLRVPCTSSERLAATLLRLADGRGRASPGQLTLNYTHSELGQLIGASRETVTRLMKRFERRGVIKAKHSTLHITDPGALREMAQLT